MTAVTTVALLGRKEGMSAALFSKYWRDVHGMLATRIPGFESYVQFHLQSPPTTTPSNGIANESLHGIAIVDFTSEAERTGLADSEVAALIRQDEINLFQSSLLYNLPPGADCLWQITSSMEQAQQKHYFLLLQSSGGDPANLVETLRGNLIPALTHRPEITRLRLFDLQGGDAGHWRTPGVDNQLSAHNRFDAMLQVTGSGDTLPALVQQALAGLSASRAVLYPAGAAYPMVEGGRPSQLGLRGLDVLQTIEAAGAVNQLEPQLLQCLYGVSPSAPAQDTGFSA